MPAPVTPESFGAVGDGATDDTLPLESAMNSGKAVQFIGKYRITRSIAIAPQTASICWIGIGRDAKIILDAPDSGLWIDLPKTENPWGPNQQAVLMRDFTIVPKQVSNKAALYIQNRANSGSAEPTFLIDNVNVVPYSTTVYNVTGIQLHDMRNGTVSNCNIMGAYNVHPYLATGGGLVFSNSANPPARSNPVVLNVSCCQFTWFQRGLYLLSQGTGNVNAPSDWQGVTVDRTIFLGCQYGIAGWAPDMFGADVKVTNSHFNCWTRGVHLPNIWQCYIVGNTFQFIGGETYPVAIDVSSSNQPWPLFGHVAMNTINFNRSPWPIAGGNGVICGSVGGGGAYTVVQDNTMWKGNCTAVSPVVVMGGVVYQANNRVPI